MAAAPEPFVAELRDTYGRLVYTHKTHEKMAEIKSARQVATKIANLIIIALTLLAVIADLASKESDPWFNAVKVFTISSASIALIFAVVQLSFDPGGEAERYRSSAKLFLGLRDACGSLIADAMSGVGLDELRVKRDAVTRRQGEINQSAPQTTAKAYKKACDALGGSEGVTLTVEDLTRLLPEQLRPPPRP